MRGCTILLLLLCSCSLVFEARDKNSRGDSISDSGPGDISDGSATDGPSALEVVCMSSDCGNQCEAGRPCILRCTTTDACWGTVSCGDASECIVACDGLGSCRNVECTDPSSCEILCAGQQSCAQSVNCRAPDCRVLCSGTESCRGGDLQCGATAQSCDISCTGSNSCNSVISCGPVDDCTVACTGNSTCTSYVRCTEASCSVSCSETSCSGGVDCLNSTDCYVDCIDATCAVNIDCPVNCQTAQDGCDNCL
jgi:hypothetical protein